MKAILKYTDCLHDGKRVSSVLYENNISGRWQDFIDTIQ